MAAAPDFDRLIAPRGVAVVGASQDVSRIGGQPVRQLVDFGYRGGIYPVNPKYRDMKGLPCFASLRDVPQPCDIALIAVGAPHVSGAIEDCAAAGIPFAIVLTAGFREIGAEGAALEAQLRDTIRRTGVRAVGPNCIGLMNVASKAFCGFGPGFHNPDLKQGPVAFVSQSGGFAFSVVGLAEAEGIGFNYIVSAGNEVDVSSLDLIAHFLERDDTEVVVAYLEGVTDGRRLLEIGRRALELGKPVITWKVGNSSIGRAAATSHTASMTADYALYRAAFRDGGFVEISDVGELVDYTRAFRGRRLPRSNRAAIVTTSGGSGVMMADRCDALGVAMPPLADATIAELKTFIPAYASFANPADFTAQVTGRHDVVNKAFRIVLEDPNVDQLLVRYGSVQGARSDEWAQGVADLYASTDKPLLLAWSRPVDRNAASLKIIEENRIPWMLTPYRTASAAGVLWQFAQKKNRLRSRAIARPVPRAGLALPADGGALGEHASKQALATYGIPVTREIVIPADRIAGIERLPFGFPVAVKIESPDIAHKTEAGAVRLGVNSLEELRAAAGDVVAAARRYRPEARIEGVLVAQMTTGIEAILGVVNDRYFGPVVMFGLGGVFTELFGDVVHGFAPFDATTAHELIASTRAAKLLAGYRGAPPSDVDALADTLSRLSWLAADHADRIAEIDVNPVFVRPVGEGVVAADALIVARAP